MSISTKTAALGAMTLACGGAWINASKTPDEFGCSEMSHSKGRIGCKLDLLAEERIRIANGHAGILTDDQMVKLESSVKFEVTKELDRLSKLQGNPYWAEREKAKWLADGVIKLELSKDNIRLNDLALVFTGK